VTGGDPGPSRPVDAATVQRELADVDARLAEMRARATESISYRPLFGAFASGTVALLLGLVALVSVLGGIQDDDVAAGAAAGAILGVAAAALTVLTVILYRRAFRPLLALPAQRRELVARRQQLIMVLAGDGVDATGRPVPVAGGTVPADRQPSAWAAAMHARFPLGPAPAEVLRRLPADTPAWKAWLARNVGWGAAAAVLLLLGMALVGTLLTVVLAARGG
jgi:hypothetical protein